MTKICLHGLLKPLKLEALIRHTFYCFYSDMKQLVIVNNLYVSLHKSKKLAKNPNKYLSTDYVDIALKADKNFPTSFLQQKITLKHSNQVETNL